MCLDLIVLKKSETKTCLDFKHKCLHEMRLDPKSETKNVFNFVFWI
jgi:hypothetical protein